MLRNAADIRTVLFALAISSVWLWNWSTPEFEWLPFLLSAFGAVCISSMVHNHVHLTVFKPKALNVLYDYWLTLIYGYPVFAWISTHVRNHHVYNNRPGDFAPPSIISDKNNLFTLLSYPLVSGAVQQKVNFIYLRKLWASDRRKCLYYSSQLVGLLAFVSLAFFLDWRKALYCVVLPQQIALNVVLIFNYLQHVHCDEESDFNHSRNLTSPCINFFLFNNGYHTAHHMKPLVHWSELRSLHTKVATKIDPSLNEPSFFWMIVRMYFLAPFVSSFCSIDLRGRHPKLEETNPD